MTRGHGRARIGMSVMVLGLSLATLVGPARVRAHEGNSDPAVIHGCAGPNGQLRTVGVAGACTGSETALHWQDLGGLTALQAAVATLQAQVSSITTQLNSLRAHIRVEQGVINGLGGPHVIVEGANLHVRSGSLQTDDTTNLGNLVIGYNEPRGGDDTSNRTGSHNVIIGSEHQYTASGGLVAGFSNSVLDNHASVSGGERNTASAPAASVSGGTANTATGPLATVSGGQYNTASGVGASVTGGQFNVANSASASVSGGGNNTAGAIAASVCGGAQNTASHYFASVTGGDGNAASGMNSSVSGGRFNTANGTNASVTGGLNNVASGEFGSVSGGGGRFAPGDLDWAAGTLLQEQ
jgi:hypothetical protein